MCSTIAYNAYNEKKKTSRSKWNKKIQFCEEKQTNKQLQDQGAMVCSGREATIVIRLVPLRKGLLCHRTKRRVHSEPHPGKHPVDEERTRVLCSLKANNF